jgi:hypothetical protein
VHGPIPVVTEEPIALMASPLLIDAVRFAAGI